MKMFRNHCTSKYKRKYICGPWTNELTHGITEGQTDVKSEIIIQRPSEYKEKSAKSPLLKGHELDKFLTQKMI